jgi:hypothetical protein
LYKLLCLFESSYGFPMSFILYFLFVQSLTDFERHKQTAKRCALFKITNIAENRSAGTHSNAGQAVAGCTALDFLGLVSGPVWCLVHIAVYSVLLRFSSFSYIRKVQTYTLQYSPVCAALLMLVW